MTKPELLEKVRQTLGEKKDALQLMILDLQAGLANDTKSSAGDKYETSREMSNQELEKIGIQLHETNRQLALLKQLEQVTASSAVVTGSLVTASNGMFLIGIPAGTISIEETTVFCVSANAPLAQAFLHKKAGESFMYKGNTLLIHAIQ